METLNSTPAEVAQGQAQVGVKEKRKSLWLNWHIASLLVAVAISYVGFGLVAPLRTLYARTEGVNGGEIGLMGAAFIFSSFIFMFPFGWLSDRYSRIPLIVAGLIGHALITLAYLYFTSGEAFVTLRFIEGISTAAVMPSARALLADQTPTGRNGEAFGLMSAVMTFGMFAGPPVGSFLAEGFGYTLAYWAAGLAFIPAIGLVLYAFRNYHQQARVVHSMNPKADEKLPPEKLWTGPVIVGCLVRLSLSLGPGLGMTIWSLYVSDLGYSLSLIGLTYTVYAIPIVLVGPSAGRLSDRYGRLGMMFGAGILLGWMWMSYGIFPFYLYFIIGGVIEGTLDAFARSANDGYLADHSPANGRGRAQSLFSAATQLGSLLGALLSGFLYDFGKAIPFYAVGGLQSGLVVVAVLLALVIYRRKGSAVR